MIPTELFTKWTSTLLAEAFGVIDSPHGYFMDTGRSGLLATINGLTAEQASMSLRPGHASIAAHCAHVLYLLQLFNAYEAGHHPAADWDSSWTTQTVDGTAWNDLRVALHRAYDLAQTAIQARIDWAEQPFAATMMLLAHCSYHVGEIRQLLNTSSVQSTES